jgi:protein-disulfide isomerase
MFRQVISFRLAAGLLLAAGLAACKSSDPASGGPIPAGSSRAGAGPVGGAAADAPAPAARATAADSVRGSAVPPAADRRASGPATDSVAQQLLQRADKGRIQGDAAAPVWVIVASDFQCPYCQTWHAETYATLVRDYVRAGKIRIAYLNYPLNIHKNAWPAAEAALCASVQGMFWEMHDAIFTNQSRWSTMPNPVPFFDSLAVSKFALKDDDWRSCMANHSTAALVQADFERLRTAGIESTPSFFVGDRGIAGAQPTSVFRAAIDSALARASRGAAPARPRR